VDARQPDADGGGVGGESCRKEHEKHGDRRHLYTRSMFGARR
jgi:hypothetical protein